MALNFNAIADEFKRTNWNDAGTWGAGPKILVLLAILVGIPVAGFFSFNQPQIEELEAGQAKEVKLKEEYVNKKKQAINLDLHRQQLREIDTQFGALFKPAAAETRREFYAELPINVKVTGNYHDMGAFASDVGQLSRIVTLQNVQIRSAKDGLLTMDAT